MNDPVVALAALFKQGKFSPPDQQLGQVDAGVTRGWFVTFEGGDGSGKSTQLRLLTEALNEEGAPVLSTREPGGTELGAELRELLQHGPTDIDPRTEALLYAADRAYHVSTLVRPALASGFTVFSDRYIDSSVAYQGAARDLGVEEVEQLSLWATEGFQPDVTVLIDLPPTVGLGRDGAALDRMESAGAKFHEQVREQYLGLAEANPQRFLVVDGHGSVEEVFERIAGSLAGRLLTGVEP